MGDETEDSISLTTFQMNNFYSLWMHPLVLGRFLWYWLLPLTEGGDVGEVELWVVQGSIMQSLFRGRDF